MRIENQKKVFDFLTSRFKSREAFSKSDLEGLTTWQGQSFETYWSKQLRQFVTPAGPGMHRVSEAFRPFASWEKFRRHVSQVRHVAVDYQHRAYGHVLMYELFMPLTNEGHLRTTLDTLFFKDTIGALVRTLDPQELGSRFPSLEGEANDAYMDRVSSSIAEFFVGYSISHVNGRFRVPNISTLARAAEIQAEGGRYLIDETTAVVRFIFPCSSEPEALVVEWLFRSLFVESILQVVNGEQEIWMIESGMNNRLHIWKTEES